MIVLPSGGCSRNPRSTVHLVLNFNFLNKFHRQQHSVYDCFHCQHIHSAIKIYDPATPFYHPSNIYCSQSDHHTRECSAQIYELQSPPHTLTSPLDLSRASLIRPSCRLPILPLNPHTLNRSPRRIVWLLKARQRRRDGTEKIDHVMRVGEGRASASSMMVRPYALHVPCTISNVPMLRIHGRGRDDKRARDCRRMV